MKLIILEGANGSGKSTLAKQLAETYNLRAYHATRPLNSAEAIGKAFEQYELAWSLAICDRSHAISRLVYQGDNLGSLEREILERIAWHQGASCNIIYCTGQGKRNINKPHYNPQLIEETQDQERIKEEYKSIFDVIKHQKYNFEKDDISSLQLD